MVNTDGTYKYVGRLTTNFWTSTPTATSSAKQLRPDADLSRAPTPPTTREICRGPAHLRLAEALIDPEIDAITDAIQAQIVATESNVFGVSDVFLNGNRSGTFTADDPDGVRTQETNLGNLTADANLAYANQMVTDNGLAGGPVQISIKNGGGIRANIGEIVVPAGGTEAVRQPNSSVVDAERRRGEAGRRHQPERHRHDAGLQQRPGAARHHQGGVDFLPRRVGCGTADECFGRLPADLGHEVLVRRDPDRRRPTTSGWQHRSRTGRARPECGLFDENRQADRGDRSRRRDRRRSERDLPVVTLDFLANGGDEILSNLSNPNRVDLQDLDADGIDDGNALTGAATFADDGSEQDALAEYLNDNFNPDNGGTAFNQADTARRWTSASRTSPSVKIRFCPMLPA